MLGEGVGGRSALVCVIILKCGREVWLGYKEYGRHYQGSHSADLQMCFYVGETNALSSSQVFKGRQGKATAQFR